ncbi:YceD family protein [Lihuaxuella thermophila]|uniref:DUF177 domain-containing protein n=1 Tax=Lihuaxuella thermophila TaxID=1173111 RepID=A0A1H8E9N8_9BACL|nr:YceD family protein [Lihuaxuella thermophila]SEN15557.1 uncharacterized protein SAMN05444955_106178 [Lihuaxuella thermophila]
MLISLQKLNQEADQRLTFNETIQMDSLLKEVPGLIRLEPVQVKGQVVKLDSHLIEADVEQSTRAALTCSRCLTETEVPVNVRWTERFTDVEHLAGEAEEREIHFVDNELDLTPYVREALLLALPYAPVCREDCKGLCPKCGINRNAESCECQIEAIDPRLAKLQELLKDK